MMSLEILSPFSGLPFQLFNPTDTDQCFLFSSLSAELKKPIPYTPYRIITPYVSDGEPQRPKPPACMDTPLTTYGARHVSLPDIGEDSFTAPPTVRARPAALPAIHGSTIAPQSVKLQTRDVSPKQGSKPAGSHTFFQPPSVQMHSSNTPRGIAPQRMDAPSGREVHRAGNHALPVTRHAQVPQSVAPKAKNASHGHEAQVFHGRPGAPHFQVPAPQGVAKDALHDYKHGDKARAHPAISHAKVPYAQGPYYLTKAPAPPKARYPVRV